MNSVNSTRSGSASSPDDNNLRQLLDRVANNDRAAFQELYSNTTAKLFGVALRILREKAVAEDVLQEAYVRIWRNADTYDPTKSRPITWLCVIVRNVAIDELRRGGKLGFVASPSENEDIFANFPDQVAKPLPWDLQALKVCLAQLSEDERWSILLAYYEGYSREDLSERFDCPVGTIKSWLRRGLLSLRACLGEAI